MDTRPEAGSTRATIKGNRVYSQNTSGRELAAAGRQGVLHAGRSATGRTDARGRVRDGLLPVPTGAYALLVLHGRPGIKGLRSSVEQPRALGQSLLFIRLML